MAKGFKGSNPLDRLGEEISLAPEEQVAAVDPVVPKRKVGRPRTKTEPTKNINIAIPVSVLEQMEVAKTCYNNNITLYINTLIKNDLDANFDEYTTIANSLNRFK